MDIMLIIAFFPALPSLTSVWFWRIALGRVRYVWRRNERQTAADLEFGPAKGFYA